MTSLLAGSPCWLATSGLTGGRRCKSCRRRQQRERAARVKAAGR